MPGRRSALYIFLVVTLLLGVWLGHPMFFNLLYLALGLLIVSLVWTWSGVFGLHVERRPHARRSQVGRVVDETLSVRNRSLFPRLWLEVRDHSTLPAHQPGQVLVNIPPRGQREWTARTLCTLRGLYRLGPTTLVSGDPFGFFEARRHLPAASEILVYPETVPLHDFAPSAGRLPGGESRRQAAHFITPNAAGVRDYVPGDSLNRIHWLSTARRSRLTAKEFEMDPLADIWIVLDNARQVHPESIIPAFSTEEWAVKIAASVAQHFLDAQRTVGFITYAPQRAVLQPDRGVRQSTRVLELLAMTTASGQIALHDLLGLEGARFTRGTTLVIVTPSVDPRWVGAVRRLDHKGVHVVVVLIDVASFGGAAGADVVQPLRAAGVLVYVVRQGDDLRTVLSGRPAAR